MLPAPPGNIGQRLLPTVIDEIARNDPSRILYSVVKTRDPADGFQDISGLAFAQAVDRCAWHLETNLGRGRDFPTLLYMGPQDVVYAILIVACIKAGYKLLLSSPRNTLEAHVSLLEKTQCSIMLLPPNFPLPVVRQIQAAKDMQVLEIPGAQHWIMSEEPAAPYPYTKSWAEARFDPWVVLHTSGSTGMPKPIIQSHVTYSALDAFTALPALGLEDTYPALCKGRRVYLGFPLFHCAGVSMLLPASVFAGFTVVLGPFPPSADIVNAIHLHGHVQESCVAPITLIELAKDSGHLENLGRLEQITYGGGSLPQAVGDLVSTRTKLANILGTTEAGVLPHHLCEPEDWAYMRLSPTLGHEYRPVSEGLYEHVIVRHAKPELQIYQGIFGTFPDLNEWSMRDLYSKHPTKENVWLYRGRNDDIIVFSTGEKLNPVDMERKIQGHPAVSGAVICGTRRFQSSLLIEAIKPPSNESERARLLDDVWPTVQSANSESPSHGRIHRDMIVFTTADKPMPRAGKGTVQRQATVDLYAVELDALYGANELSFGSQKEYANPADAVQKIVSDVVGIEIAKVPAASDLFGLGLDSLQVTVIAKEINKYLATLGRKRLMEPRFVYANPSVDGLIAIVTALVEGKIPAQMGTAESGPEKMQKLYDLHTSGLPISARDRVLNQGKLVVLLTGSTGSLGSYILDALIAESGVAHIYCLNRGPKSLTRQQVSQSAKGLQQLTDKVTCLDADLSQDFFGLPVDVYKTLLRKATHVLHNAWQVDFNLALESFEGHVCNVRRLVDFSAHSRAGAQIFFVSSISAVANAAPFIPEQVIEDWSVPQAIGYGQSKFVAERVLDAAARVANIPTVICRVGQIAGPTTAAGIWPKQEWLPSLIASSRFLRKLPASLGRMETIDWIPSDILGRGIVELALREAETDEDRHAGTAAGALVYHAVNPRQTSWEELVGAIARALNAGGANAETVSLDVWLEALRCSALEEEDMAANPAIKILDFYENLVKGENPRLDTDQTLRASPTLAALEPIHREWVENWMRQWSF